MKNVGRKRITMVVLLLLLLIAPLIFNFYTSTRGSSVFNSKIYAVEWNQSYNGVKTGDLIVLTKFKFDENGKLDLEDGDLVAISEIGKNKITSLGISKSHGDGKITMEDGRVFNGNQILGRKIGIIPYLGYFFLTLKHPIFIGLVVALFAYKIIGRISHNLKEERSPEKVEKKKSFKLVRRPRMIFKNKNENNNESL